MTPIEELDYHLKMAFNSACKLADQYPDNEPLAVGRAVRSYTLPNLKLWIDGAQAGNLKHLQELINSKEETK
jgi:hypothetical protein